MMQMETKSQEYREFQKICRTCGWKCTPQRWGIWKYLNGNRTHPAVEAVWEHVRREIPTITRESVYRILNEFVSHGLLGRIDQIELARYDTNLAWHGHFICSECGKIIDFPSEYLKTLSSDSEFGKVDKVELRVVGTCSDCRKNHKLQTKKGEKTR